MGCPDFWDTPCSIFAADNTIVESKNLNVMAGIYLLFVMVVALGSLVDGYVKELNRRGPTIRFSNEDKIIVKNMIK